MGEEQRRHLNNKGRSNSGSESMWGPGVLSKTSLIPVELFHDNVKILGKNKGEKLLSLEALFINKFKPTLNSKDEYRSRTLTLKF